MNFAEQMQQQKLAANLMDFVGRRSSAYTQRLDREQKASSFDTSNSSHAYHHGVGRERAS
jgi:hypothetical protein